jgi:hypothetical protein
MALMKADPGEVTMLPEAMDDVDAIREQLRQPLAVTATDVG